VTADRTAAVRGVDRTGRCIGGFPSAFWWKWVGETNVAQACGDLPQEAGKETVLF